MNCQDHLYRNCDPGAVSRRWFLQQCGVGLGAIALAELLARNANGATTAFGESAGSQSLTFPAKAKSVIFLFMAGGPESSGAVRQQAATGQVRRAAAAGRVAQGLSGRVHQSEFEPAGAAVQVRPLWPERCRAVGAAAAPGGRRRRIGHRQVDGHRRLQSRARPDPDEHRLAAVRPAEHGRVGDLRPGERVAGSARLRRVQLRHQGAQRRQFELGQRLSADRLSGRPVPRHGRSGAVSLQSAGRRSRRAARLARRDRLAQPDAAGKNGRSGNRHADPLVRDGVPHAGKRAGTDGLRPRAEAHSRNVRRRAGQTVVRQQLPAGPAAGRARRAVRPAVSRGVGPARQPGQGTQARTARTPIRRARP